MPSLSSTAYGAAALRAAENLLPEDKRLFDDPYSEKLLPPIYKFFVMIMRPPILWKQSVPLSLIDNTFIKQD